MLESNIRKIAAAVDAKRLLRSVEEIACHHRIQASPGYHDAAASCRDKLAAQQIPAQLLSFPATEETTFDTYPGFQEWSCNTAWCELSDGYRIADFESQPMSVIQRSIACDFRDRPLPVIPLDRGEDPDAYRDLDLAGSLVFVRGDFNRYFWAVEQYHAAGFLTDFVLEVEGSRTRADQIDTLRYTSFWWETGMPKCFGFVLTPREGDRLAAKIAEATARGEVLTARCYIDASLYDGTLEDVTAFLPGETDEEVLLTAHLCHPRASANDNASGCAAAMEAIRVIHELIVSGALPPLRRGIRILLVPEFTGSYAYLARIGEDSRRIVAAMNLDMVGGRQGDGYGPLTLTDLPLAAPSIAGDLAEFILGELKKEVPALNGELLALFHSHVESFTGGSDHIIFSDPQIGIPSLMLGQWPDKWYHTSDDTLARIDPHLLAVSCSLAACYAYTLAVLAPEDLNAVFSSAALRLTRDLAGCCYARDTGTLSQDQFAAKVHRRTDYAIRCAADALRFFSGEQRTQADRLASAAKKRLCGIAAAWSGLNADDLGQPFCPAFEMSPAPCGPIGPKTVLARTRRTLPQLSKTPAFLTAEQRSLLGRLRPQCERVLGTDGTTLLFYYINGTRTVREIAALLDLDLNLQTETELCSILDALCQIGYLRIVC